MSQNTDKRGEIVIFQTANGIIDLDVRLDKETVWLTQNQMGTLFDKDRRTISAHINNIFKEGELEREVVCQKYWHTTQHGAVAGKTQQSEVTEYNLDVIISVGYRVKSRQGTQFRIWANKILKEYIIKGYAVSNKLKLNQYEDLKQTIKLLSNVVQNKELSNDEATGLLRVISDYTYALDTLDKYDYQQLAVEKTTDKETFRATYETAMEAVGLLKNKFNSSDLFANEKDQSFRSSINTIYQTFDGKDLYPSVEEKAAMLLYLVTKNHSFSDGNKRIAAFLFLWFLEKNGILYKSNGLRLIENNTLVALTLMIAESRTEEKDVMVKVIVNLINGDN
ncbi:MAG: virulence RhuM family protein [Dysgonamonadaceae bacterium]|jgi:prophage maintenance system killer protein|nr:virulence RhuM family protein [Dysgonamonadaceae bacterium]